jgi:broad specificity phosphatase PhoE
MSGKILILVRHGESASNAGLPTADPGSYSLTQHGHEQARRFANIWSMADRPDLIVTSRYTRTQETAAPFLTKFHSVPNETWNVQEFSQLSPEQYNGTRVPHVQAYWARRDPHFCDGPGAETYSSFLERVHGFFHQVLTRRERYIVVFTHGHFMQQALYQTLAATEPRACAEEMDAFRAFATGLPIPNLGMLCFRHDWEFVDHAWSISKLWRYPSIKDAAPV